MRASRILKGLVCVLVVAMFTGCASFEKNTYQTLSASKAVIDTAGADYNAGNIARTPVAHDVIAQAQAAQNVAVTTFQEYLYMKRAGSKQADLVQKQTDIISALANLTNAIAQVEALRKAFNASPPAPVGGVS